MAGSRAGSRHPVAMASGRPSGHASSRSRWQNLDEMPQSRLEDVELSVVSALLGSEHGRSPVRSEKRVGDISGDDEVDSVQIDQSSGLDPGDAAESAAVGVETPPCGVEEDDTQGGQHAGPTVRARAAAEREHDAPGTDVAGGKDGLTEPVA